MKTNSQNSLYNHVHKKTESQVKQAQEYFQKYMNKVAKQKLHSNQNNENIFGFNQGSTECSSKNTSSLFDKTANFGKIVSTNLLTQNVSEGPKQLKNLKLIKHNSDHIQSEMPNPVQSCRQLMKINIRGMKLQKLQKHNNFFPEKQEKQEKPDQQKRRIHLEYSQSKLVNRLFDEQEKKGERKQSADKVFIVRRQNNFKSQFIE